MGLRKLLKSLTSGGEVVDIVNEAITQVDANTEKIGEKLDKKACEINLKTRGSYSVSNIAYSYDCQQISRNGNNVLILRFKKEFLGTWTGQNVLVEMILNRSISTPLKLLFNMRLNPGSYSLFCTPIGYTEELVTKIGEYSGDPAILISNKGSWWSWAQCSVNIITNSFYDKIVFNRDYCSMIYTNMDNKYFQEI